MFKPGERFCYSGSNYTLLRLIVENSKRYSVNLSICGEIAGEPLYTMLLIGLGYRNFSMSSALMHQIKRIIRSVTIKECEEFADDLIKLESTSLIEEKITSVMTNKFPKIFT